MARYMRSYGKSTLRPPAVVGAGVSFKGPSVRVSPSFRGVPKSKFVTPPFVVGNGVAFDGPSVRLAPQSRGAPKSTLRPPPPVVGPGVAFSGPRVKLVTPINSRQPVRHLLRAPVVVRGPNRPLNVRLAYSRRGRPRSRIAAPTVVFAAPLTAPVVATSFAYSRRGAPRSRLEPPVVVGPGNAAFGPGVRLAGPVNRRFGVQSRLGKPTIVTSTAVVSPPTLVNLAPSQRALAKSHVGAPLVVAGPISFRGPSVKLTLPANARAPVRSRLASPTVVATPGTLARPTQVKLAPFRHVQTRPRLEPPAAVYPGIAFPGPGVRLVSPINSRRIIRFRLAPPTVVGAAFVASPGRVKLVPSRRPATLSRLFGPVVVFGIVPRGPAVALARTFRTRTISRLFPPTTTTTAAQVFSGPGVNLTFQARGRAISRLRPPAVVGNGIVFRPVQVAVTKAKPPERFWRLSPPTVVVPSTQVYFGPLVKLAYSLRGKPKSKLSQPAVVGAGVVFRPVKVALAPSKRGTPKSRLFPPVIPPLARPTATTLARIKTPKTRTRLAPPAVVGNGIVFRPVDATLVRIKPPQRYWRLNPPTVVVPITQIYFGPATSLTYQTRGRPASQLNPPAVVGNGIYFRPVAAKLAPSKRGTAKSKLNPPILAFVVPPVEERIAAKLVAAELPGRATHSVLAPPAVVGNPVAFRGPAATLAYSSRGAPSSRLSPPTVVAFGVAFLGISTTSTYSRRGTPVSHLRPPATVGSGIAFRGPAVSLVRIKVPQRFSNLNPPPAVLGNGVAFRGPSVVLTRIKVPQRFSNLSPPTAVVSATQVYYGPTVRLTYSHRGKTASKLSAPAVVGSGVAFKGPAAFLTPSKRGKPTSHLRPPAVVGAPVAFRGPARTLAPSRRPHPTSTLRTPAVVHVEPFRGITFTLARIRPPKRYWKLSPPPPIVGRGVAFHGPSVHVGRIRPPRTHWQLSPPAVVVTVTPGFTCGYPIGQGAAESSSVAGGASNIQSVGGFAGEISDENGGLPK